MKGILKADLSRAFKNWRFPLAVFLMFLVWELNSRRFGIREDALFMFVHVWGRSITYLMAILVSSIPFLSAHMEEKEHHFLRYSILRAGVKKYVCSKVLVSFLSAFAVCVLGTVLFLMKQNLTVPLVAPDSITLENFAPMSCLSDLMVEHTGVVVGIQTVLYGIQCGTMCILSMAFSVYIHHSLGVYMIPFLMYYCFYNIFRSFFQNCSILNIESVYNCITCYTKNPVLFFLYVCFVTVCLGSIGRALMYRKVKGEFQ